MSSPSVPLCLARECAKDLTSATSCSCLALQISTCTVSVTHPWFNRVQRQAVHSYQLQVHLGCSGQRVAKVKVLQFRAPTPNLPARDDVLVFECGDKTASCCPPLESSSARTWIRAVVGTSQPKRFRRFRCHNPAMASKPPASCLR